MASENGAQPAVRRTNNVHLPAAEELAHIIQVEAERPLPAGKQAVHYFEPSTIIELLDAYGLTADLFTEPPADIFAAVAAGHRTLDDLTAKILAHAPSAEQQACLDAAYSYLAEEDEPQPADLLYVFGAKTLLRAEKALELYQAGLAPHILLTGGQPVYGEAGQSEAAAYAAFLREAGVPERAIIIEDAAITVPDNVRRSLNLLDELQLAPRSILLVNSPYAQRRGWCVFNKYLPDGVRLGRCNSLTGEAYLPGNWFKQESSLRVVLNEFIKLRASEVYNSA